MPDRFYERHLQIWQKDVDKDERFRHDGEYILCIFESGLFGLESIADEGARVTLTLDEIKDIAKLAEEASENLESEQT